MSNALAIAAVTATLRQRLEKVAGEELGGGFVTTLPLDQVRNKDSQKENQINIYLYQAVSNPAWSNRNLPSRTKPGETGPQPLALNLFYLITPYSVDTNFLSDHKLLGLIMQTLNDYPVLGPKEIEEAFPESNLQHQVEKVRLVQIDLSLEDMSRVWSTCQTEYRLSVAYEASVVLITGPRPIKTPIPVLSINTAGIQPDLILPQPSVPTIEAMFLPNEQTSIRLGEMLTLQGYNLKGDEISVIFDHSRLTESIELPPQSGGNDREIKVRLDLTRTDWLTGIYTITVKIRRNNRQYTTNAISLFLSPSIKIEGIVEYKKEKLLRIHCTPSVLLWQENERLMGGQSVFLLVGDRELSPQPLQPNSLDSSQIEPLSSEVNNPANVLFFALRNFQPGDYYVRLRVDGVDSIFVNRTVKPPKFDQTQIVEIS